MPPPIAPDPRLLGDFFVGGEATLGALGEIYGLAVDAEHRETTLADYFLEQLGRPPRKGDMLQLGAIALVAHKVADGRLETVGLRLADPDPVMPAPAGPQAALRPILRRAAALLGRVWRMS